MSNGRRFEMARERAASALLVYLDERSLQNERELIDATHDLEAVAHRRLLELDAPRERRHRLARLAMSR